jgi:endo-1,4-beta-xylanase
LGVGYVKGILLGWALCVGLLATGAGAAADPPDKPGDQPPGHVKQDTLRWAAPNKFNVGSTVAGGGHHESQDYPDPFTHDTEYRKLLAAEFNSVTPENQLKWEFVHPERDVYNFGPTDAVVDFARRNNQEVRGHTLLWHSQNPAWLEEGDFTDEELREILREHIMTVVSRYAGQIDQWDVANEIFTDTWEGGEIRLREQNIFIRELGPEIIADAFRWAHEADPTAKLFLNDYAIEHLGPKSNAYYEFAKELLAQGVPLHGMGFQGHLGMQYGFPGNFQQNLQRFSDLGLETAVTELDVRMVLDESGRPTQQQLAQQADWYRWMLEACLAVEGCNSFTLWGFPDKYSWVPVFFPDQGAATVMWEDFERKPAYYALQDTLLEARPGSKALREHHPAYADR